MSDVNLNDMRTLRDARKTESWWDTQGGWLIYDAATSMFRLGDWPVSNPDAERTLKVTGVEAVETEVVTQAADAAWEDYKEAYLKLNPLKPSRL